MRLIDADKISDELRQYEFDGKYSGCTIGDLIDSQETVPTVTVQTIYDLTNKTKEHWAISVFSEDGMKEYAYINDFYTIDLVISSVLKAEILCMTYSYNSVHLKIKDIPNFDFKKADQLRNDRLYKTH